MAYKKTSGDEKPDLGISKKSPKKGAKGSQVSPAPVSSSTPSSAAPTLAAPPGLMQPSAMVLPDGAPLPAPKSKRRFVNLLALGDSGITDLLPGRHRCDCLATRHALINNCTSCGRVVCVQEGAGPCMFCDSVVVTPEQLDVLQRGSKKSEKMLQQIMRDAAAATATGQAYAMQQGDAGLAKALAQRDRLVLFDRTSAARSRVIDDESDYFASDTNR
jgi:hypothetical protein